MALRIAIESSVDFCSISTLSSSAISWSRMSRAFFIVRCCTKFSMHLMERWAGPPTRADKPTPCRDGSTCRGLSSCPSRSLIGRCLRDRHHVQVLHSRTGVE
ncbi:hypothetical protein PENTCL1PPCAC_9299 [Pristionchus entomophagus]|uniref:Ribosomal protein n=1 Tax=Pristionchus entomophagus TaxID=358040 RepID=A0AAV5SW40_9BILA|nr:hypothetical protein PENTCL1PPCAC_9299 [Pristionchus entomophagus]